LNSDTYRIPVPQTTIWMKASNNNLLPDAYVYFIYDTVEKKLRVIDTGSAVPINGTISGVPTVIGYSWSPEALFYELIPINDDTIIGIPYRNSVNYVNNTGELRQQHRRDAGLQHCDADDAQSLSPLTPQAASRDLWVTLPNPAADPIHHAGRLSVSRRPFTRSGDVDCSPMPGTKTLDKPHVVPSPIHTLMMVSL